MSYEEKMLRFRKMANAMATIANEKSIPPEWDFRRASHLCVCDHCGLEYVDHPELPNRLFLLCDARLVHL